MLLVPAVPLLDLPPVAAVPPALVAPPFVWPPVVAVAPPVTAELPPAPPVLPGVGLTTPLQPGIEAPNNMAAAAVGQILMLGAERDTAR